ncbi:hypothetical protein COD67_07620 [Bacillus cereus]|nr:hypothetical protein COI89_08685 [Bacillus cereus]PGU68125.1 hypothetical protein COD67_07620 [Bacillus cereus]
MVIHSNVIQENKSNNELQVDLKLLKDQLRKWISSGECQKSSGAFCAWREVSNGNLSFEYPEITGYALTYFSNITDLKAIERKSAEKAASWLMERIKAGNLNGRIDKTDVVYSFDLAMIATGLMSYGLKVENKDYVNVGMEIVDILINYIKKNEKLSSIITPHEFGNSDKWSITGSAHLLKVIQCMLLAESLGMLQAGIYAEQLLKSTIKLVGTNGSFQTSPQNLTTYLHPHLYATEGLWIWGTAKNDNSTLFQAKESLEWVFSKQMPSGGFPEHVINNSCESTLLKEQSDVTSQIIRLANLLGSTFPGYHRSLERLNEITYGDEEAKAIVYAPESEHIHQNTWATFFAVQAIESALEKTPSLAWQKLI